MRLLFWLTFLLFTPHVAMTGEDMRTIPADVLSVYDGDTLDVRAHIWPGVEQHVSVRILGVDTPEKYGKCTYERQLALRAREKLVALVGSEVILTQIQHGKYAGRVVARVSTPDGVDVADQLIKSGLGYPYYGGKRQKWCDETD